MPRPILIDTDAGVDDALALIFALRSPELSVKAVTTVAGNVSVDKCTRNVLKVLGLVSPAEPVHVALGSANPLRHALVTAPEVHGRDGLGDVRPSPRPAAMRVLSDAPGLILDLCDRYERRLTIVALGPLTNLARAWKRRPASLKKAGRIISMGGAFRVPGNTGPVAEFNYFVDPDAADLILTSGLQVRIVPLDLTEQIVLMRAELQYRAHRRPNQLSRFIMRCTKSYMAYHKATEGFNGGYVHDPLAVAAAIDETWFRWLRTEVRVETKGELTRGMSVADFRKRPAPLKSAVSVALGVEKEKFLRTLHARLWA
jgi:purine nucleosidase/pyrimidine-specific ribonucleoside hydrolase